jgi:dTDP-glucose 4,6-dehydratase
MIYYIDIDNTICTTNGMDYENSTPIKERISKINSLYDKGNTIIYWTARGTGSGIDWSKITISQFDRWNVKYHKLKFGKPVYDIFIDDKNINSENFFDNA